MLRNSDCRFTRGYYIGHPCRDFAVPVTCKVASNVHLGLLKAQARRLRQCESVLAKPNPQISRESRRGWQNKAPIGAADIITPDK